MIVSALSLSLRYIERLREREIYRDSLTKDFIEKLKAFQVSSLNSACLKPKTLIKLKENSSQSIVFAT